jgi:hypothetical protein
VRQFFRRYLLKTQIPMNVFVLQEIDTLVTEVTRKLSTRDWIGTSGA